MELVKAAKKEFKDAKTDAKHSKSAASKEYVTVMSYIFIAVWQHPT